MKYLGPLSSLISSVRTFYVDASNQLDATELITAVAGSSSDGDLTFDSSGVLSEDITTKDGTVLAAGKTMYFRVSCSVNKTAVSPINLQYNTDSNNTGITTVYLKIVPTIQ